jgi:hypothetical protein
MIDCDAIGPGAGPVFVDCNAIGPGFDGHGSSRATTDRINQFATGVKNWPK